MIKIVYIIVIMFILLQIFYFIFDVVFIFELFDNNIWLMEYYDVIFNIGIVVFFVNYVSNLFIYWIILFSCVCKCSLIKNLL